jgi:ABC-type hemin transport system substrate-binding protein
VLVVPFDTLPPEYETIRATGTTVVSVVSPPNIGIRNRLAHTYHILMQSTGCDLLSEAAVAELLAEIPERERVAEDAPSVLYVSSTGWTAGAGTDIDELIALAGGQNAAAAAGIEGEMELAAEVAAAIKPDFLLLDRGLGEGSDEATLPANIARLLAAVPDERVLRYHLFDLMAYDVDFVDVIKEMHRAFHGAG